MKAEDYRKQSGAKGGFERISFDEYHKRRRAAHNAQKKPFPVANPKEAKELASMKTALKIAGIAFAEEHRFHPKRKWRFDIALPEHKIAIEYEGVFRGKSRHTTPIGYTKDTEKYNQAAMLGWKILRYTALNYTNMLDNVLFLLM